MAQMEIIWPEVFGTDGFRYKKGDEALACADGLVGWGNCAFCRGRIPDDFGKGMIKIGQFLGIDPTADKLMKYADTLNS